MFNADNIHTLGDFSQNAEEHIRRLKETGLPEVLTINGRAEVVVQDAEAYQSLLEKADFLEMAQEIQDGLDAHAKGQGVSMRTALEQLASEGDVQLEP